MVGSTAQPNQNPDHFFAWFMARKICTVVVSIILFGGGVFLLSARISGWGTLLGVPATVTGFIFLIFTFDEMARSRVGPKNLHLVKCSVCGKPTLAPFWQEEKICPVCEDKISQKTKSKN